jgi:DNA-binding NtrC family response regulator
MRSLLIVEDDPLVRKTLASQLAKKGFDIAVAETGEDGVRTFGEKAPDLVLLDVRLPDIDGLEVLRRIRERNRRAVILVMTAFDDMKTTVEAIKLGAFEYLVKPLNATELDLAIEKAFQVRALEEKVSYLVEEKKKEYTIDNIIGRSRPSITTAPTATSPSSSSTARPSRTRCSSRSSSATSRAPSPTPSARPRASSRSPARAPCSSTRSATSRPTSRASSSGSSSRATS